MVLTDALEARTREIGGQLIEAARGDRGGVFAPGVWSERLIDWALKDRAFRVQLFRFVDAFPTLPSAEAIHDCLVDYLTQPGVTLPPGMEWGLQAGRLAKGVFSRTVRRQIASLASRFIAGEDARAALPVLERLWHRGEAFSIDLLGEACTSRVEAEVYRRRYLELIETLARHTAEWPGRTPLERDHLGPIPRANVSIKISSLDPKLDPIDFEGTIRRLADTLHPILTAARDRHVTVNFDMEQHARKDLTVALFQRCAEEVEFPAAIALQAYLRSGRDDARRLIAWAKTTGRRVTVRLIKGAYWDYEVVHAQERGWPVPVWTKKQQTDACFEQMAQQLVAALPRRADEGGVTLALGSHNARSIARGLALLEKHGLPESAIEVQMLYGMAEPLGAAAVARGLRVRQYVPVGEMIPGMAYLVRRLLENTSNESWLRAGFSAHAPDEQLLASPHEGLGLDDAQPPPAEVAARAAHHHQLGPAVDGLEDATPFFNEAWRDFSCRRQREQFAEAIARARVPRPGPPATTADAQRAVARAAGAFAAWRDRPPLDRARMLMRAAGRMHQRRDELAGMVIGEAGKTWREADADVCEAIDFCRYYAGTAVELFTPRRLGRFVGERNHLWHQPRGVAVVISPWNFPLAICAGMTVAALATGNTAIVKPSTQTPGCAMALCEILWQAGVPRDVLQLVVGPGSRVGAALVRDPRVALIAFTGSKAVGLEILAAAGQTGPDQQHVKKVVCEMGGKNAVIVDQSADLDEAVLGVRASAFGYGGQKCSACSRVIVLDSVHDLFLKRLVESTRSLVLGDPADPATDLGPMIDQAAAEKMRHYIDIGRREGRLELAVEAPPGLARRVGKPFVGPHIFSAILPQHRLAGEEIFGPLLSVMRAADFDRAIQMANASSYKLTGGVYSRRPAHLEKARRQFRVGNLYLNRAITGALVGRQPFGGFGLSGTGSKAGGEDYLKHFLLPRSCTENTIRHGFAPGVEQSVGRVATRH